MVRIHGTGTDWDGVYGRVKADLSYETVNWPRECVIVPADDSWPMSGPKQHVVRVVKLRLIERISDRRFVE